jgi:hypothetical protein
VRHTRSARYRIPLGPKPLGRRLYEETLMEKQFRKKLIHEGPYMAEVDVVYLETEDAWSPYLSVEDALKLDNVRKALREDNIETAAGLAKVYELTPVVH